jgi:hypothetical protein
MPFDKETKARMFIRCARLCCLCHRQCGANIEAAHIIDEAAGGPNTEENGIPLCFDCHQEVGAYNDKHPRGNKFSPEELQARRDRVYQIVASGGVFTPSLAKLKNPGVVRRFGARQQPGKKARQPKMTLKSTGYDITNPSVAEVVTAIDNLDGREWDRAYVILSDGSFENAFVQACQKRTLGYRAEYRDGASQRQYRSIHEMSVEAVKFLFLTYLKHDDSFKHAIEWMDVTAQLTNPTFPR